MVSSQVAENPVDTRLALREAAARLFAARGFYGASIAAIAAELGITKQALLHHFGTKERLYGEVLEHISDRLVALVAAAAAPSADPVARLQQVLLTLLVDEASNSGETDLLVRELLDNRRRAATASTWYLTSFLDTLTEMVRRAPGWERASKPQALACVYQLLGAVSYFAISRPTLSSMYGERGYEAVREAFTARLSVLVETTLTHPPQGD